jgi:PKHD-type hydroxylase
MHIAIADVLDAVQLETVRATLKRATFVDGRVTAGANAARVKSNTQATGTELEPIAELVQDALLTNSLFSMAARPKSIIGPTFSRYMTGNAYGAHVDEPIMAGQRTDLAFTLFLSDPAGYDGGELVIDGPEGENALKLPAGSVFLYPATTLHRVAPVVRGERLAAVGWVRSLIRRSDQRELLFDLDTAHRRLCAESGQTENTDLLAKTIANLIRMWADD